MSPPPDGCGVVFSSPQHHHHHHHHHHHNHHHHNHHNNHHHNSHNQHDLFYPAIHKSFSQHLDDDDEDDTVDDDENEKIIFLIDLDEEEEEEKKEALSCIDERVISNGMRSNNPILAAAAACIAMNALSPDGSGEIVHDDEELHNHSSSSSDESSSHSSSGMVDVPKGEGIMIHLDSRTGRVHMEIQRDAHYSHIHPNCHAPAGFDNMRHLAGGGSGVCVFGGDHPELGPIVMKHGGAKDTVEVLSLAGIAKELCIRGGAGEGSGGGGTDDCDLQGSTAAAAAAAADYMRKRIPEFVMVYMTPYHLRNRNKELWAVLRHFALTTLIHQHRRSKERQRRRKNSFGGTSASSVSHRRRLSILFADYNTCLENERQQQRQRQRQDLISNEHAAIAVDDSYLAVSQSNHNHSFQHHHSERSNFDETSRGLLSVGRNDESDEPHFDIQGQHVALLIPGLEPDGTIPRGIEFLEDFEEELCEEQNSNNWKVTLAQKKIGSESSENGARVMTKGHLNGRLLEVLVQEFTTLMTNLQLLTHPEERGCVAGIREDFREFRSTPEIYEVTQEMNEFVGSCIDKNFMPSNGRFPKLRKFGKMFRDYSAKGSGGVGSGCESNLLLTPQEHNLHLTPQEQYPAKMLGKLLKRGSNMHAVIANAPPSCCALDLAETKWLNVIEHAVSIDIPAATECIWTCGLTDAGLHNLFLSEERGIELFDLGEPQLVPQPAFLTKFLMSFFHVFGMEDRDDYIGGDWIVHFQEDSNNNEKIRLTEETNERIPSAYEAFRTATDYFVEHIFEGEESVRRLMSKYVVLQLLSDASFCLNRWQKKGGGSIRRGNGAETGLEKWLWRSIWDLYIATDVCNRLNVDFESL